MMDELNEKHNKKWVYEQLTGRIFFDDGLRMHLVDTGYSGNGEGLNNPDLQAVRNVGPIPVGYYRIGKLDDLTNSSGKLLRLAMRLTPAPNNKMFSRAGFMIHGDNVHLNHTASEGCIILQRPTRLKIGTSGVDILKVR